MPAVDAIEAILTRTSVRRAVEPAPEGADLELLLRAALRAPDHGLLRPWRFVLVRGEALDRLGEVFARALAARRPDAPEEDLARERAKTRRAPLLLVVVSRPRAGVANVPVVEQVLSAGAAAVNVLLAAHALGYGAMWRTGAAAYHPLVHDALGLDPEESIVGFLYLGTPADSAGPPRPPEPEMAQFVSEWTG
jgi:nitroreductase